MRPTIDWKECIKDSPSFRAALEDAEEDMDSLEVHLEKLLKHCDWMHEAGKVFYSANSAFISSVRDLMTHFNDDCFVLEALGRFSQTLSDWQNFHNMMLEQCNQCFSQNINNFIKTDIRRVKESRKQFRKLADEMDGALNRNAQAPRSKPDDCDEISSQLDIVRSSFMQTSLQHVLEINLMQLRKRLDLLNAMFSYIQTQSKFVRQGFELFTNLEPYNQKLKSELDELYRKSTTEKRHMTEKHKALLSGDISLLGLGNSDQPLSSEVKMEGYLFKRTSNAFKTWVRRWFVVENNQLLYCSRQRSKESTTVLEKDLRLCNVKPCCDTDRRFCFQIISPLRCHVLQADSEADCQKWKTAIQDGASKAYSKSISPNLPESKPEEAPIPRRFSAPSASPKPSKEPEQAPSTQSRHVLTILSVMGNTACCDCGLKDPRWASINFGITLCIECSGIHRSFGVHKSKVRSLTLDAWDDDHVGLMTHLGNTLVNRVFEAAVDRNVQRAHPGCSREVREVWITAKYLQRAFVQPEVSAPRLASPPGSTSRSGRHSTMLNSSPSFSDVHHLSCNQATVMKQVASQDSGLGGSGDVTLCAFSVGDQNSSLGLEDTRSAVSDLEMDTDVSVSTTDDTPKPCVNTMLCRSALAGNIPEMLRALALGAVPNWNCSAEGGKTALIRAIESGDVLAMEFLLLNGAKTDVVDDFGRTPLHHAAALRRTTHVYQLIRRNANQRLKDVNGEDALDIAVKNTDANIVTLLRLARLNDEMKETDALYDIQDEMFSEVFKDFGNLRNIPEDQEDRL